MDIVEGKETLELCDTEEKRKKWKQKDSKANYYIMRTIDKKIKTHVLCCEVQVQCTKN